MNYLNTYLKGILMGIADLVPGISGGTIALITGIYQRLINAIAAINITAIKLFFTGKFKQFWQHIDGWFLTAVFGGILSAIFAMASLVKYLLTTFPILTWAFFFGLIVASAFVLIKHVKGIKLMNMIALLAGLGLGYVLSIYSSMALPDGNWAIFIAGSIAVSAMILPGLSGTLILILLGKYQQMLTAVENWDFVTLSIFLAGIVVGLMLFSRLLKWLLAHFYQNTILFLAGLMLGTLVKVWPWKVLEKNALPWNLAEPQLIASGLLMLLGATIVLVFAKIEK
ncbi:MAG: DUF368 domain-containing protein [Proteobacteria bacterium]|nr:DUF368 domain-containing protein [Pseudomonadota bacterium]